MKFDPRPRITSYTISKAKYGFEFVQRNNAVEQGFTNIGGRRQASGYFAQYHVIPRAVHTTNELYDASLYAAH
jgi:hypothetical protein